MPDPGCPSIRGRRYLLRYDLDHDRLSETTPLAPHDLYGTCKKSLFEVAQRILGAHRRQRSDAANLLFVWPASRMCGGSCHRSRARCLRAKRRRSRLASRCATTCTSKTSHPRFGRVATSDSTGAVNVASGEAVTIAQIATRVGADPRPPDLVAPRRAPYREGEPMHILSDATRASPDARASRPATTSTAACGRRSTGGGSRWPLPDGRAWGPEDFGLRAHLQPRRRCSGHFSTRSFARRSPTSK